MKRGITLLYLLFIILSLLPYSLEKKKRINIFQDIAGWIVYPYRIFFNTINELLKIKSENEILKKELISTKVELNRMKIFKLENEELKKILQFTFDKKIFIEPIQVISINEEGGNRIYICKKKTYNIISENLPVIGYEGLIGKVKEISNEFIIVQSIKHTNSFISVMTTRTGVKGILSWNGNFIIEGISVNEDIKVGDTIVTSGMGGVYPKGLNVGIVSEIRNSIRDYETIVYVKTFEDIKFYDQIFVMFSE